MENIITIDVLDRDTIRITTKRGGKVLDVRDVPYEGAVDSKLLTAVDNMFNARILDKLATIVVKPGLGIDKTSLLYRITITLGAALGRTELGH